MHRKVLQWLVCPKCRRELNLVAHQEAGEVEEGTLTCSHCAREYPITRGIPRFVPLENYATTFGHQWGRYARLQLDSQNHTTFSRDRFYAITEWQPSSLTDKLVLDAGCGSGRFAEISLAAGAEVIAVDLSSAVDPCRVNLGGNPRLHCVQASLYELPFRDRQFDFVYCIGVIQHTPDPKKSVQCLLDKVAVGGSAGMWIYELSWKAFVGTMAFKYFLRPWTKRWSISTQESFSAWVERVCWPVLRWARHRGTFGKAIMRMLPAASAHIQEVPLDDADFREWVRLDTFDAYSPAHDHPQTFPRVKSWFEGAGFRVDPRHPHGAISITGTRDSRPA